MDKRRALFILAIINAVLLGSLVWRATDDTAQAQTRRPGEYLMIPASVTGVTVDVVFVLDMANGELGGLAANNQDRIEAMPKLNLTQLFDQALQQGAPPAPEQGNRRGNNR